MRAQGVPFFRFVQFFGAESVECEGYHCNALVDKIQTKQKQNTIGLDFVLMQRVCSVKGVFGRQQQVFPLALLQTHHLLTSFYNFNWCSALCIVFAFIHQSHHLLTSCWGGILRNVVMNFDMNHIFQEIQMFWSLSWEWHLIMNKFTNYDFWLIECEWPCSLSLCQTAVLEQV